MMFDSRICKLEKFTNICEKLQNAKADDVLCLRKSIHGYYPVFTQRANSLLKINENIFNPNLPKSHAITDFKDHVIKFFTSNAKNSFEHKTMSLQTLIYLKGFFSNSPKKVNEINAAIQEIKNQKEGFYYVNSKNLITAMREDQETCDFTIYCRDGEIKAQWCIFNKTPFFKFRTGVWKEQANEEKSCDLKQFPIAVVKVLVDLLYFIPLKKNTPLDILLWLYDLSNYLLLNEIKEMVKINLKILFKKDVDFFADALIYSCQNFEFNSPVLEHFFDINLINFFDINLIKRLTVEKKKEVANILIMLAEQNHPIAQNLLAWCYMKGHGLEKDLKKALELYLRSAEQGYAPAQYNLAWCYEKSEGVENDLKKIVELYIRSAEQGYAPAQNNLAWRYEKGEGVEKDLKKAVELYTRSAGQGYAYAQCNLAFCYRDGEGVEKDIKKAVELFTLSAEQGFAPAQCNLAMCYIEGDAVQKDLKKAVELYTRSAEQGYAAAQNNLAVFYVKGIGGVQKDLKKAVELYTRSAKQGYAAAQDNLAVCYEKGIGVEKDLEKAVKLYCRQFF